MNTISEKEQILRRLEKQLRGLFEGVVGRKYDFRRFAEELLSEERAAEQLNLVRDSIGSPLSGKKLLEIGSGFGVFLNVAEEQYDALAFGVEPDPSEFNGTIEGCKEYFRLKGMRPRVVSGEGEMLPFRDMTMDIVCAYNVLEHVKDPAEVIEESVRVLKAGGIGFFVVPNYGSWWEGHYNVLWFPNMPKWIARIYIKLFGRKTDFLETLNLINIKYMKKVIGKYDGRIEVLSWGKDVWRKRLLTLDFKEWAGLGRLKRILRILHLLKIHRLISGIGWRLNWHTPIILVFKKL